MWPGSTAPASGAEPDPGDRPDGDGAEGAPGTRPGYGARPARTTWDATAVRSVVEAAVATVGADAGVVAYVSGRRLVRLASIGFGEGAFSAWPLALNSEGPLVEAVAAGHSVWVHDAPELQTRYPRLQPRQTAATGGFIPVVVDGRTVGALGVTFGGEHDWTPDEMARLERVATGLESPLRRWAMAERRRAAQDELDALRTEASGQARLDRAARLVAESLGGDTVIVSVASHDGDWLDRFGVFHVDGGAEVELRRILADRIRVGENQSSAAIVTGQSMVIPEIDPERYVAGAPARFRGFFDQWPAHGTMAFPVPGPDGDPVAVVTTVRHRPNEPYDESDRDWVADAAASLGELVAAPVPDHAGEARRLVPLADSPWGIVLGVALPAAISGLLAIPTEGSGFRPSAALLAAVVAVAVLAGRRAAVVASGITLFTLQWIVLTPRFGFGWEQNNLIALSVYAISCLLVVLLVGRLERATRALVELEREAAVARQQEMRERLAAAERQSFADSRFRSLVEATTSVTWRSDATGQLVEPQPSWEAYTGQPWSEQMGSGWGDMVHPDDRGVVTDAWAAALAEGATFELPFRLWSAHHGEHRRAVARAVPLRDRHGHTVEWIGTITDVHEQYRLLRELDVTRAQLEALMDADVLAFMFGEEEQITHANEAFLSLTGTGPADLAAGRLNWRALTPPGWEEADRYALQQLDRTGRTTAYEKEFMHTDGRRVPVEIGIVALDREPLRWAAYVVDLTERKATELVLREAYEQRDHVARTLQTSLLPPALPEPPGLRFIARYLPSPVGEGVGGDFYDVYPTADGAWHVVIGDVCGRGPDAAALTALTRYTLRAASVHETDPAPILGLLNDAVLSGTTDDRFCTVAYAVLHRAGDRWRTKLALGGHHQPRILRAGEVLTVGAAGTLVGIFDSPRFPEVELVLEPGDIVVTFTDGLIEQQNPPFDEHDLDALLDRCARAGADLDAVVAAIEAQVPPEQSRDDDTAILAFAVERSFERPAEGSVERPAS